VAAGEIGSRRDRAQLSNFAARGCDDSWRILRRVARGPYEISLSFPSTKVLEAGTVRFTAPSGGGRRIRFKYQGTELEKSIDDHYGRRYGFTYCGNETESHFSQIGEIQLDIAKREARQGA
jgi:hypothetical protein